MIRSGHDYRHSRQGSQSWVGATMMGYMLRHIVAWNYADGNTPEQNRSNALKAKADLEALPGVIPEIKSLKVYTDPEATSNRALLLDSTFADAAALATYANHPAHLKVVEFINKTMKDRVVLDYVET